MIITSTVQDIRAARHTEPGQTWGLVPTMGALHEAHLALVRRARAENDRVGVSIFVNPIQFNNADDLAAYPRDPERDLALLKAEGIDLLWTPGETEMYPPGFQTYVETTEITRPLEGASRPGHFRGVTTVVNKLFNVFEPTRAYFGRKDAQQVAVITQMVRDLAINVQIVPCETVREPDGLALSSRNQRLTPNQRAAAPVLYRSLHQADLLWQTGERNPDALRAAVQAELNAEPLARIEYISAANPVTLVELTTPARSALISMAVIIGEVRLIDNITLT